MLFTRDIKRQFDLLRLLTEKEIILKYRRSYLGIFWSLLNPLLFSIILFVAFKMILRFEVKDYLLFILSALFPWTWFSTSVTISSGSLISNVNLIKKVIFPRYFLPISVILAQLVNLLFAIPIVIGLVFLHNRSPNLIWLAGVPVLIFVQTIITSGFSFAVSSMNAYFRDIEHLIGVFITMLFYITPIFYPIDIVPESYRFYFNLNPLTPLMSSWRKLFMENIIDWHAIGVSSLLSLISLIIGFFIFRQLGRRLDEVL
jgi:lipopolysaccharide transport system permease protein